MENSHGVENLFFDLASESRLGILYELKNHRMKMNDLARKLDLTSTEAFRQLQRLSEEQLVQRQPDSAYVLTEYCKLVLQLSPALDFVYRHKEYFLSRDIWRIPSEFLNRIGELSSTQLETEVADTLNHGQRMMKDAEEYVWTLHDRGLDYIGPILLDRYNAGVKSFKFLFAENLLPPNNRPSSGRPEVEERTIPATPAIIVCTEKEAGICLLSIDGKADYAGGFCGKDPTFRKWANDLFLHFWNAGKRVFQT